MRVRIGALIELVFVVAVGFGYMRFATSESNSELSLLGFRDIVPALCLGQGIGYGYAIGVIVEKARRRSPEFWGFGRRYWTLLLVLMASNLVIFSVMEVVHSWPNGRFPENFPAVNHTIQMQVLFMFLLWIPMWIFSWISGDRKRGVADGREWAGRVLCIAYLPLFSFAVLMFGF